MNVQGGQFLHHQAPAFQAAGAELAQDALELVIFVIHEVPQHVNLIPRDVGAKLNPGYYSQVWELLSCLVSLRQAFGCVVV